MKIYFHGHVRTSAAGYKDVVLVTLPPGAWLDDEFLDCLTQKLCSEICYPAGSPHSLLVISHDCGIEARVHAAMPWPVRCRTFQGGIFNPHLPVRPYDVWDASPEGA